MKTIFTLACILAVLTANAQPPPAEGSLESRRASRLGKAMSRASREVKSSEIVAGNVIYSGIVVELLKTDNPLKLMNPPASPQSGPPEDRVTRGW
jgi:hypothetical protein